MTLIEKLEQVIVEHNAEFNKIIKDATDHQKIAHTAVLAGLLSAIKVAKQHSNWISVDERLPDKDAVVLAYKQEFGLIGTAKYSGNGFWGFDKRTRDPMHNFTFMGGVTHWQPLPSLPSLPSEVQDD